MSVGVAQTHQSVAQKRHSVTFLSVYERRRRLAAARKPNEYKGELITWCGIESAILGGYYIPQLIHQRRGLMSTRAQIGIYEDNDIKAKPVAIIYRHSDGYPTGAGAVLPDLVQYVSEIVEARGTYDPEYLAAQLVYRFIENHDCGLSGLGYGVSSELHGDIRFYYAVTPEGVHVFDAREITSLANVKAHKPMFSTAWVEPERVRAVEKELSELTARIAVKQVELRGLKSKQYR